MRSCLTAFLFTLLLIGVIVGVGALAIGQMRTGLCADQPLRVVLSLVLGALVLGAALVVLFSLINLELFEKSLSGFQIGVLGLFLTLLGVGIAAFLTYRSTQASCPRPDMANGLAQVCQGLGLASDGQSAPAQPQSVFTSTFQPNISGLDNSPDPSRLVVLGEQGQTISWTKQAQKEWTPKDASQVALVVCSGEPQRVLIETCNYGGGVKINRYREEVAVRLVAAQSGQNIVSAALTGEPPPCQPMGIQNLLRLHGKVQYAQVKAWVASVLAGKPAPGVTPTPSLPPPTATPVPTNTITPSPSPTPQVIGKVVTGARFRAGPSKKDKIIGGLSAGDKVVVLGANSDWTWLNVQTQEGQIGWVFAALVKLPVPYTDIPHAP
jgi:hypothetical protein